MSEVKSTEKTEKGKRRSIIQVECDKNLEEREVRTSEVMLANYKAIDEKPDDTMKVDKKLEDFHASTESLYSIENTIKRGKRGAAIIASSKMTKSPSVIQRERSKIKHLKGDELDEVIASTKQKFNQFQNIIEQMQMKKRCRSFDPRETGSMKSNNEVNTANKKNIKRDEFSSPPPIGNKPSFSSQRVTKKIRLTDKSEENDLKFSSSLENLTAPSTLKSMSRSSSRSSSPCSIDLNYKLTTDTCSISKTMQVIQKTL